MTPPTLFVAQDSVPGAVRADAADLQSMDCCFREIVVDASRLGHSDDLVVLRKLRRVCVDGAVLTLRNATSGLCANLTLAGFDVVHLDTHRNLVRAKAVKRPASRASCSVIVPCRNEVDNIEPLVRRMPQIGTATEIIFVDGSSTDGTPEEVVRVSGDLPWKKVRLLRQGGNGGKAAAVFEGFDAAIHDVVMILDADMTVAPEDAPRFFDALAEGAGQFANGTRFVYPMAASAMPDANRLGNAVFAHVVGRVIGRRLSDTLCGSKALWRADWQRLRSIRPLFGGHDPWGDFDLLLGAAYLGLSIVEVPVPYGARVAGESKMRPFQDGPILLKTVARGAWQLGLRQRFGASAA